MLTSIFVRTNVVFFLLLNMSLCLLWPTHSHLSVALALLLSATVQLLTLTLLTILLYVFRCVTIRIRGHANSSRWFLPGFEVTMSSFSFPELDYEIRRLDHTVGNGAHTDGEVPELLLFSSFPLFPTTKHECSLAEENGDRVTNSPKLNPKNLRSLGQWISFCSANLLLQNKWMWTRMPLSLIHSWFDSWI